MSSKNLRKLGKHLELMILYLKAFCLIWKMLHTWKDREVKSQS